MKDDLLYVDLVNDRKLLRDIDNIPDIVRVVIRQKIIEWTDQLRDLVISNIQTRLNKISGKLESSVAVEILEEGLRIEGRVYIAGVPYAVAQEKGAIIPPHMIYPKNGKVLAFMAATGDKIFATRVFHPGGVIPPHYFMKDAYREMSPKVTGGLYYHIVRKIKDQLKRAG